MLNSVPKAVSLVPCSGADIGMEVNGARPARLTFLPVLFRFHGRASSLFTQHSVS